MLHFILKLQKKTASHKVYAACIAIILLCSQIGFAQIAEPASGENKSNSVPLYEFLELDFDIPEVEKRALGGDVNAQLQIGWYYEVQGVAPEDYLPNREKAFYWFNMAANHGSQEAKNQIRWNDEIKQLEGQALSGDIQAQCKLGESYFGRGMAFQQIKVNKQRGLYWYRQAGNQGYIPAMLELGFLYHHALDRKKAIYWFEKAAEKGSVSGQYGLGEVLVRGDREYGTEPPPEDISRGMAWLHKAADSGNIYAQHSLGYIYDDGKLVHRDTAEALKWLSLASKDAKLSFEINQLCTQKIKEISASMSKAELKEFKRRYSEWLVTHKHNREETYIFFLE